ncbi:Uncharacterised protein [Mycobacterium tuberculosis]|uniref:Uncharacterized protein n=1 Tax=Mycobacterium tuberculosis TaxID=1773 RepID=A0A916LDS5_MYCTX|nr:Uncharacterised protein [Mycobacterium tuberculosis]CKS72753.1 Uncharacterised protein [Mycobacterium tuberculosis]CNL70467.1 Uncharacterised protein [Mycobacterium tuberculosis]CNM34953.1 Uncharacterised protein [Mycobacterium tuberculosis]CNM44811.1 Uncharacterised protein [Mycobacterium tuberculosis]
MSSGPIGTASTTLSAPCARATWHAALAVAPVAMPSSTITAIRPVNGMRSRPRRKRSARRCSSISCLRSTASMAAASRCVPRTTSSLSTRTPSSPMAPKANSGWNGTPSLRTTRTSSGACSDLATSKATGTPPRGKPRTTTALPDSCARRCANWRPASPRSSKSFICRVCRHLMAPNMELGPWAD